jgi:hypothetical protein
MRSLPKSATAEAASTDYVDVNLRGAGWRKR